jgi:hypothetical protein
VVARDQPSVPAARGGRRQLGTRLNYRSSSYVSTSSTGALASARADQAGAAFLPGRALRVSRRSSDAGAELKGNRGGASAARCPFAPGATAAHGFGRPTVPRSRR